MITGEDIKKYCWYFFGIIGVVLFWAGVWDGLGHLPYIEKPWVSFLLGVIMLSFSGVIFKGANPLWESERNVASVIKKIHQHPLKHEFMIKYKDMAYKKELPLSAKNLKDIEKEFLVFIEKDGREIFVPFHRITQILHKGKSYWKY